MGIKDTLYLTQLAEYNPASLHVNGGRFPSSLIPILSPDTFRCERVGAFLFGGNDGESL